jgi:ubiquinone/menaquinone biosynthesis C-methylase UbiE
MAVLGRAYRESKVHGGAPSSEVGHILPAILRSDVRPSTPSAHVWAKYDVEQIPSTTEVSADLLESLPRPRTVIDLGCGTGRCIDAIEVIAARSVVEVDVNYWAVHRAREHCGESRHSGFVAADGNLLPFEDDVFDLAVAQAFFTVIPTLAERTAIIEEVRRVTRPGGYLYVGDFLQDRANAHYLQRYELGYELVGEYGTFPVEDSNGNITYFAHHFGDDELPELLAGQGFEVLKSHFVKMQTYSGNIIPGISLISRLKL